MVSKYQAQNRIKEMSLLTNNEMIMSINNNNEMKLIDNNNQLMMENVPIKLKMN